MFDVGDTQFVVDDLPLASKDCNTVLAPLLEPLRSNRSHTNAVAVLEAPQLVQLRGEDMHEHDLAGD